MATSTDRTMFEGAVADRERDEKVWRAARASLMAAESALMLAQLARDAARAAMDQPQDYTHFHDARLLAQQAARAARESEDAATEAVRGRHLLDLVTPENEAQATAQIGEATRSSIRASIRACDRADRQMVPHYLRSPEIEAMRPSNRVTPTRDRRS